MSAWLWWSVHKRQFVPCLSALQCFRSLCLSLLSSLMISTAVIINSLIWCQHSLVHSPDARAHTLEMQAHIPCAHACTITLSPDGDTVITLCLCVFSHTNNHAHKHTLAQQALQISSQCSLQGIDISLLSCLVKHTL